MSLALKQKNNTLDGIEAEIKKASYSKNREQALKKIIQKLKKENIHE